VHGTKTSNLIAKKSTKISTKQSETIATKCNVHVCTVHAKQSAQLLHRTHCRQHIDHHHPDA